MSNYFTSPDDLKEWVKSRKSSDEAATELMGIIGQGNVVQEEQSIVDTCRSIYDNSDENASSVLFGVLAKHNLTTMKKEAQYDFGRHSPRHDISSTIGRSRYLPREEVVKLLEGVGIACYGHEKDFELQNALEANIKDGTISSELVDEIAHEYIQDSAQSARFSGNETAMEKQSQSQASQSRQRNGWVKGMRNKWNRVVDGFNEGTPWRIDRDKMYNFTHYYTDAISFDEDPSAVYSGEAIWRNYIMDKYSREYQDKDGKWVGGYINNRFYVFPDAGTPSNPDVPRDGGNQMGLKDGERTRKPRPHQWSIERRMEDARGNETKDIVLANRDIKIVKTSKTSVANDICQDKIYNIFRDTIEMREAGFEYENMLDMISTHYNTSILNVAQIDMEAQKLLQKHSNIFYQFTKTATIIPRMTFITNEDLEVVPSSNLSSVVLLPKGTTIVSIDNGNEFKSIDSVLVDVFTFKNGLDLSKLTSLDDGAEGHTIQDAADELGLNEESYVNSSPNNDTEFNVIEN